MALALKIERQLGPTRVTLSHEQMQWAVGVGVEKTARSYRDGWSHKAGCGDEQGRLKINIEGCCAELAAGLALGVPWAGDAFNRGPDLGIRVQVRHTDLSYGSLIVRGDDADDAIYVLVTGEGPDFLVHGWLWGRDAKRPQFFHAGNSRSRHPCWMVPQGCPPLRPLAELEGLEK